MNGIFRQKSIDKINSPESLNDYVRVTNPSVWIILIGTLFLIIGATIFGVFVKVDTTIGMAVSVTNGTITAYVDEADMGRIDKDMSANINGIECSIQSIAIRPVKSTEIDEYVLHKGNMENSKWLYPIIFDGSLEDGVYKGSIIVEQISPVSYIFN